jgi:hypothetical protein
MSAGSCMILHTLNSFRKAQGACDRDPGLRERAGRITPASGLRARRETRGLVPSRRGWPSYNQLRPVGGRARRLITGIARIRPRLSCARTPLAAQPPPGRGIEGEQMRTRSASSNSRRPPGPRRARVHASHRERARRDRQPRAAPRERVRGRRLLRLVCRRRNLGCILDASAQGPGPNWVGEPATERDRAGSRLDRGPECCEPHKAGSAPKGRPNRVLAVASTKAWKGKTCEARDASHINARAAWCTA